MLRLLALDFDGVISDSAPESFVVALGAFAELWPEAAIARAADALSLDRAPSLEWVRAHPLYAPFLTSMPLGNRAEDYAVVLVALASATELVDQVAYDALRAAQSPERLEAFHRRFYARRHALAAADPVGWHGLMSAYPGIPALLRRMSRRLILAIATSKDAVSVRALLRAYGIEDLFEADRLLDKEVGSSKTAHLERLHHETAVAYAEMLFIDDKQNHLERVATLGVPCALAAWGYNGVREVTEARAAGHLVCTLAAFESQLERRVRGDTR